MAQTGLGSMDRRNLLHWIDMVSFCMLDISLYLDTHPTDQEAMNYFEHYKKLRCEAMEMYSRKFAPLLLDQASSDSHWKWVLAPWPWEGGSC